jgi:hypothetical protein
LATSSIIIDGLATGAVQKGEANQNCNAFDANQQVHEVWR